MSTRPNTRVEVKHKRRRYYIGTFRHSRVAKEVERQATDLLEAGDKAAFADLMDRYAKHRTDDDTAQVA